jgi:transposase
MNETPPREVPLPGLELSAGTGSALRSAEALGPPRVKAVNRAQTAFQVIEVEQLIEADHPARAIWQLTGGLDLSGLYDSIQAVEGSAGRTAWDPRLLLSLWAYAYSRGISSARELERRCRYDPAFQWLCGLERINYHTLSDFRVGQDESLRELFAQVLGVLRAEGLVSLERLMQDGTKVKAQAAKSSFRREEALREHLAAAREQVAAMGDPRGEESVRQVAARARAAQEREQRLQQALEQLAAIRENKKEGQEKAEARVSLSDPEARVMKQPDGGFAPSYNVQVSTDAANQAIVGVGVSQRGTDFGELVPAMERVAQTFQAKPGQVVADGGFTSRENILAMAGAGIDFYGSEKEANPDNAGQLAKRGISREFYPSAFAYDGTSDTYRCPAGQTLRPTKRKERSDMIEHSYQAQRGVCQGCAFRDACCGKRGEQGREVVRVEERAEVQAFRQKMQSAAAVQIYRQRGPVAEFSNLWLKEKIGLRQFRLRGLRKVGLEALWACLTYNLQLWIRLRWLPKLAASAV